MKGRTLKGFCYSYLTSTGDEILHVASFGKSKTKAKKYFNSNNNQKLEPVKKHNFYAVEIAVLDLIEANDSL